MKRGIVFLLGIVVGIGLVLGVAALRGPSASAAAAPAVSPTAAKADSRAEGSAAGRESGDKEKPSRTLAADIERLVRWTEGKEPKLGPGDVQDILGRWSEQDAAAALAFVENAPRFPNRNQALAVPLEFLCRHDPHLTIAWLQGHVAVEQERGEIAELILNQLPEGAALQGLTLAFAENIPVVAESFGRMMGLLARTQPDEALRQLAQLPTGARSEAAAGLLQGWAAKDPERALGWFVGCPYRDGNTIRSLMSACLENGRFTSAQVIERLQLSTDELPAALMVLASSGEPLDERLLARVTVGERGEIISRMTWQCFPEDPDQMLRLIKSTLPAAEQRAVLDNGWQAWVRSDRKAALAWAQSLPDRKIGESLLIWDKLQRMEVNPEEVLTMVGNINDPDEKKNATEYAVNRLVWNKPEQVANWLLQNNALLADPEIIGRLTMSYLRDDDIAAMDWMARLPAGEARDNALASAVSYWARKEDATFVDIALKSIASESKRSAAVFRSYQSMHHRDAAVADRFLEEQGITPEVRQSWKAIVTS